MVVDTSLSLTKASLTPEQKKYLKGLAHAINPSVIIGKEGLTESLLKEVRLALKSHELIKVKFNKSKDEKSDYSNKIATELGADLVAIIGNMTILYKAAEKKEDRKIRLPKK